MSSHADNPLLEPWPQPLGLPPFHRIDASHFAPAFEVAMREHRAEIATIARNPDPPTFGNTIAALDACGRAYARVGAVFHNLTASETSPALQAVERELAPRIAAHDNAILLDDELFARVDALHSQRDSLGLGPEERMLLERVHLDFTMAGARLAPAARRRAGEIAERLASLTTTFRQNVLHDEATQGLALEHERDLAGLPAWLRDAAREAARRRGAPNAWWISISRSIVVPFLERSDRRDLRERAFRLWTRRGELDAAHDNRPVAREILKLRHELARLHDFRHFADYALTDRMAKTPAAVARLLERVWGPAKAKAARERDALQAMARACGAAHAIEPWDWRYYAEKVRRERYELDDAEVKPYFVLDRMLEAAFDCATRLFGVRFVPRADLKAYHPDVRVYEVQDAAGGAVALFLSDNFMRPTKRGGAWMSSYRDQSRLHGALPIVVNNNNFAKAPEGEPTLLSADDVRTLFHEFGHGLHGMLSQVTYERLSGTGVLRDFVELPSQLFEHWAFEPQVLKRHARHAVTGAPIPDALIERLRESRRFNQGFETVEYAACALVDMALHGVDDPDGVDIAAFEAAELDRIGMPREIVMRHRLPHFDHLFAGSWYAAGYYVYLWAEVLDADAYEAFVEAGDVFDPAIAARLLRCVYAAGGSVDPAAAYRAFRGRDPAIEPMLADRGLIDEPVAA
ncbi:MAG TPA: M3 family metallopeptidase [Casimicrobiaceae bacterium]|nr:M3 family metallopeptidase [Casimicrobiaceae bacterium]